MMGSVELLSGFLLLLPPGPVRQQTIEVRDDFSFCGKAANQFCFKFNHKIRANVVECFYAHSIDRTSIA